MVTWEQLSAEQREAFLMGGRVLYRKWMFDGSQPLDGPPKPDPPTYTSEMLDKYIEEARLQLTKYYGVTDTWLYSALDKYPLPESLVAIIGSTLPWYEAIAISRGAVPVTIDYNKIPTQDQRLVFRTVEEQDASGTKFSAVMSISSFEHSGMGRYGEPIDPDGDLGAMEWAKGLLVPGGLLYLAVPQGDEDVLLWNAHRQYGPERLPLLLHGWEVLDQFGGSNLVNGEQPVLVLRKNE